MDRKDWLAVVCLVAITAMFLWGLWDVTGLVGVELGGK